MKFPIIGKIKRPLRVGFANFKLLDVFSILLVGLSALLAYFLRGIVHEYLRWLFIIGVPLAVWFLTLNSRQNPEKKNLSTVRFAFKQNKETYYTYDPLKEGVFIEDEN